NCLVKASRLVLRQRLLRRPAYPACLLRESTGLLCRRERACGLASDGEKPPSSPTPGFSPGLRRWQHRQGAGAAFQTEVSMSNTFATTEVTDLKVGVEGASAGAHIPETETHIAKSSRARRRRDASKTSHFKKQRNAAVATKQDVVLQMLRRRSGASID